jgi:hypothetical protein
MFGSVCGPEREPCGEPVGPDRFGPMCAAAAVAALAVLFLGSCGAGAQPGLDSCLETCDLRAECNAALDVESCRDDCEQMPRRCARSRDLAADLDDCAAEPCLEVGACDLAVRVAHLCASSE